MKQVDKYTTLSIEERKGIYSILEGWINQNGDFKPNFCKREFGGKGEKTEKNVPVFINALRPSREAASEAEDKGRQK